MSGYYPQYPGEDPGPVVPPQAHPPQPRPQPPQPPPQPRWQPPAPPEPRRPAEELLVRPTTVTVAVWTMVAGAVLTVISAAVSFALVDYLRETLERELRADPTIDEAFIDGFTGFFMAGMVVVLGGSAMISAGVWLWMAWKNAQGRSWARITATCLGGANIAMTLGSGGLSAIDYATSDLPLPSTWILLTVGAVTLALLAVSALALALLWWGPASTWFNALNAQRRWEQWSAQRQRFAAG